MADFYFVTCVAGFGLALVAYVGSGADLAFGHGDGFGGGALNLVTASGFLLWFGACGSTFDGFGAWSRATVFLGALSGGLAGALPFACLFRCLFDARAVSLPASPLEALRGARGRIRASAGPSAVGEVLFEDGRCFAARSADQAVIERGARVVVVDYVAGVVLVQRVEDTQEDVC